MDRLGLGSDELTRENQGLVYLSLPGFSSRDEELSCVQAWEGVVAASVGQCTDMGLNRVLMGINPSFSPLTLASAYASVLPAAAVNFALFSRKSSGCGDVIEVPLAAALMEGLAYNAMHVEDLPERYKSRREREIDRRRSSGEPMNMSYEALQEYLDPFYRTYICADGKPFYAVCSSHTRHPIRALELLGIWDEIKAAGVPMDDPYLPMSEWKEDPECTLLAYPLTGKWAELVSSTMKQAFLSKTAEEWETIFGENGVPGTAHRMTKDWISSDHALTSGLILELDDAVYGRMRVAGNVSWLGSDNKEVVIKSPAPELNADRDEILSALDVWEASEVKDKFVDQAETNREYLSGVRVLDLTNVIAGPTIASLLSRFGAEVISLNPVKPMLDPWNSIVFGMQANRGKRSLLADIKKPEGRELLVRLVKDSDVVTINAMDRQLESLGISYDELKEINPEIILCQFDAYGGPKRGPRSEYPGYDDLVQATTGIMARFGGSIETPEEHAHFGTIDVLGGYCAALAIGVALVKGANGGGGDLARSSLAAAGQLIQIPFMYDFEGRSPFNEPSGRHIKGAHALYRCYRASDDWFFFAVEEKQIGRLSSVKELADFATLAVGGREAFLEMTFAQQSCDYWVKTLQSVDVGALKLDSMAGVRARNLYCESKGDVDLFNPTTAFTRNASHPCGKTVDLVAPNAIRPQSRGIIFPATAPKYGQHSREIMRELDYSDHEINDLIDSSIIADKWSDQYMPD